MERNQRRPPDVEEALSSMLWTPYEHTPTDSSSDEDEKLNIKLKKSKTNFEHNNNNNNNINNNLNNINNNFPNQQYVPLNRKLERYDNFRFSYPYYGPVPTVQKCITELPSYESLYQNITPVLTNITTGLNGRLVHSFTDNFITQNQSGNMPISENGTTIFITNSEHFTDTGSIAEISSSSSTSIGQMQVSSVSECSNNELLCMNQIKNVTKTNHDHFLNFELWQQNDNNSGGDLLIGHACNNDDDDDDDDGDEDDDNHDFRNSTNIEQLQNYNSSRENQLQTNDAATTTNQYNISATNKNVTSKIEIHNYNRNNNNTNNGNQSILPGDRGGDHDDDDENFLGVSKLREENNMSSCSIVSRDFDIDQRMTIPTTATATTPPILPWNILKNGVCKTVVEEYEKQETSCDSSGTGNTFDNNNTGCIAHVKTTEILSNVNSMMAFSSVRNVETVRSTLTDIRNSSFLHSNNNSNDNFGAVSSSCASSFSSSVIRSDNSTDDQILEINSCSNNNNNNNININNNNNKNSENSINIRNFAVNVRNTFLAMRLNVQGAASIVQTIKNGNNTNFNSNIRNTITNNTMTTITPTTTSVFLPITDTTTTNVHNNNNNNINSNNNNNNNNNVGIIRRNYNISSNGTHMGAIVQPQPSLTIQVNQINENHSSSSEELSNIINHDQQISRNLVNQSISTTTTTTGTSGISVVNCYSNSNLNNINNNSSSVVPHPNNINSVNNFISINNNTNTNNINNNNEYRDVNIIVPNIIKTNSNDNNIGKCLNNNSFSGRNDIIINNNNNINNNGLPIASTTVSRLSTSLENNGNTITTTNNNNNNRGNRTNERTFTSTESQTDDLIEQTDIINSNSNDNNISPSNMIHQNQTDALISREQRRRERRERRQQGRTTRHPHIIPPPPPPVIRPILPDILHSHYPPPYTALTLTNHPPPPPPPSSLITPVISTVPIATTVNDGRFTIPLPVIRRSPSERSGKGCCGQWFAGPPLRALIAVVALGGVACALGGAALGATGLAGPPTSHLTAALLMIGVGVILVTVSGAAWRMTAPGGPPCLGLGSTVDLGRCGRRPCNSRGAPHGLLYPEFQHRPPPPSYQASMQEYRLRLLLLDRDRQNGVVRGSSPPPTYRSHAGSLLRAPLSTATTQSTRNGHSGNGSIGGNNSIGGPGSEYSLPPSYRSRNPNNILNNTNNNNNLSSSRPPTSFGDGESMESLASNIYNTLSSLGNLPENHNDNNINHISRTSIEQQHRSRTDEENDINMISTMTNNTTTTKEQTDNNMDKEQHRNGATKIKTPIKIHNYNKNPNIESQNHNNYNEKLNPRVINNNNNLNINNNNDNIINNSDSCMNLSPSSKNLTKQATNCEQSSVGMKNTRKELVTIVTISSNNNNNNNNSNNNTNQNSEQSTEMEILAHL